MFKHLKAMESRSVFKAETQAKLFSFELPPCGQAFLPFFFREPSRAFQNFKMGALTYNLRQSIEIRRQDAAA